MRFLRKFFNDGAGDAGGGAPDVTDIDFSHGFKPADESLPGDQGDGDGSGEGDNGDVNSGSDNGDNGGSNGGSGDQGGNSGSGDNGDGKGGGSAAAQSQTVTDWAEAIKTVEKTDVLQKLGDRSEILKALKVPDFVVNLVEHLESGKDAAEFLRISSVNYSEMSDDDILKAGIRKDNPGASEAVINKLFQKELEKYETDPDQFDQETVEMGNYLKKQAADRFRSQFTEEQKKYLIPEKTAPAKTEAEIKAEKETQEKIEAINKSISESDVTKSLLADKKILIGGKDGHQFEIAGDPKEYVDYALGNKNLFSLFAKEDGSVDLGLFYATVAFIKNRGDYEKAAIVHGETKANKKRIEGDNSYPPGDSGDGDGGEESGFDALNFKGSARSRY